jgi:hypothetical protein
MGGNATQIKDREIGIFFSLGNFILIIIKGFFINFFSSDYFGGENFCPKLKIVYLYMPLTHNKFAR